MASKPALATCKFNGTQELIQALGTPAPEQPKYYYLFLELHLGGDDCCATPYCQSILAFLTHT